MSVAKWFLIPALCAAITFGTASTALAAGKHHRAKSVAAKKVTKRAAMSKTLKAPKKRRPAVKKKASHLKPASHSLKHSSLESTVQGSARTVVA